MAITFRRPADFFAMVGQPLGASAWITVEQDRINLFADATGDHQWIHVDPERAKAGPFGGTIAHGFWTLSAAPFIMRGGEGIQVRLPSRMGVNYGCDRVRFPAPVPVGARIRGVCELLRAEPMDGNGVQATVRVTVEIEGSTKPGCVADTISRYFFA